jgi:ABC-type transport system substrate-binding protein
VVEARVPVIPGSRAAPAGEASPSAAREGTVVGADCQPDMKWFYVISLLTVALLTASPFVLLNSKATEYRGKVVSYGLYGAKVKSIDPATCGDTTSSSIQGSVYESLYTYHYLKRPLEVIPQLAATLPEVSADGLTYTIALKKGVKYARNACFGFDPDGRAATRTMRAGDFVLAFKRVADYHLVTKLALAFVEDKIVGLKEYRDRTSTYAAGDFSRYTREDLPGVKALDEHTLQIRLVKPFPQLLYVLAISVYAPIPHEMIDYHLSTEDKDAKRLPIPVRDRNPEILRMEAMVGTGPYVMTTWEKAGLIVLERNPDYRDDYYPTEGAPGDAAAGLLDDAGKKLPFVDVRYVLFVAESNPAWMMFEKKLVDTSAIPRDVYASVITPTQQLTDELQKKGVRLVKSTYPGVYWLAFNMDDKVLGASKSLRQALCLCFDVETYIDLLYNGRAIRAVNTVPSDFKGHDEAGPSPYARFDVEATRAKLEDARRELVAAGVVKPGEGIPTLTLDLGGRDEQSRRFGEFCKRQFGRVGVELDIEPNDWPTLQEKVNNKLTQIYSMGWQADYPDAENFLQLYYTPNIDRGTNNTNYSNPKFDELYAKASVCTDEAERVRLYVEMIRILNEDCPVLLLTEPVSYALLYDWVHNYKPHPIAYDVRKYTRIDTELRKEMGGGR